MIAIWGENDLMVPPDQPVANLKTLTPHVYFYFFYLANYAGYCTHNLTMWTCCIT